MYSSTGRYIHIYLGYIYHYISSSRTPSQLHYRPSFTNTGGFTVFHDIAAGTTYSTYVVYVPPPTSLLSRYGVGHLLLIWVRVRASSPSWSRRLPPGRFCFFFFGFFSLPEAVFFIGAPLSSSFGLTSTTGVSSSDELLSLLLLSSSSSSSSSSSHHYHL